MAATVSVWTGSALRPVGTRGIWDGTKLRPVSRKVSQIGYVTVTLHTPAATAIFAGAGGLTATAKPAIAKAAALGGSGQLTTSSTRLSTSKIGYVTVDLTGPHTYPVATKKASTLSGYPDLRTIINNLSTDTVIDLEGATFMDGDFSMGGNVYTYYGGHLIGLVNGTATITPNSSTHASAVNAQVAANTGTVQETVMRIGRGSSQSTTPYLGDLNIPAEPEGHIYNGLVVYYCTNALLEYVTLNGYQGTSGAPPGETFALNNYQSTGSVFRHITIDGQGTMAAGLGSSNCTTLRVENSSFSNSGHGAGITNYQTSNPTFISCTLDGNHLYGINCEKVTGTVNVVSCTFRNTGVAHMCVDTDGASAIVNIYDPVYDFAKFTIKRHTTYDYPPPAVDPNGQNISDFHIFRGGTWSGGSLGVGTYVGGTETTSTELQVVT